MEKFKEVHLKDLYDELVMGQSPNSETYNDERKGLPFVQGNADMKDGAPKIRIYTTDPKKLSQKDDLLLSVRAPVGDLFKNNIGEIAIGRGLSAIRISNQHLNNYVHYYFSWDKRQFLKLEQGTTFTEIGKREVRNLKVTLPENPKEQTAIATILSKVDEAIEATQNSIKAAEKLKKALMQNLLTGKLKPDGTWRTDDEFYEDEKFGKYPKDWNFSRFKDYAVLQRGKDLTDNEVVNGEFPVVKSNGVQIHHNQFFVEPPGVVTGRSGTIGKAFYIEEKFWAHNTTLYIKDFKGNCPKFIYYLILRMDFRRYYAGTTVPTLNRNDIHRLKIAIPKTEKEQKDIADKLDECDNMLESKQTKIQTLQRLKKSLMQNLLTGKVRVDVEAVSKLLKQEPNG